MWRFVRLQPGFPAARICTPPARLFATDHGNIDANTAEQRHSVEPAALKSDEPDLEALFTFGENLSGVDPHNKTIKTAAGSLPISPLLDPTWRKARKRIKKKPPPPFDRMPRFQRNMKRNAYGKRARTFSMKCKTLNFGRTAQLLAEPVRQCHVTRTRLPKPFLQSFGLVTHPETNDLWWIPAGLEKVSKTSATDSFEKAEAQTVNEDEAVSSSESKPTESDSQSQEGVTAPASCVDSAAERTSPAKQSGAFRAPAHVLARQDLLMEFLEKNSKYGDGQFKFTAVKSIGDKAGKATWRKDMHAVVREHLRRGIVDELINVSQTCETGERTYLIKVQTPQESLKYQNRNCFLRLSGSYTPFDYMEVPDVPGSARPVYHLPELLGQEQFKRLKQAAPLFADESLLQESASVMLLKGLPNVEVNKKLWRLQGFLADYMGRN